MGAVVVLILLSCALLAIQNPHRPIGSPDVVRALEIVDLVFTGLFILEAVLKVGPVLDALSQGVPGEGIGPGHAVGASPGGQGRHGAGRAES